jgi:uncharacterized protein
MLPIETGVGIALIAFLAEFVDTTLGMGYGTLLTPLLLLLGFSPIEVIPSVLVSEFATGLLAGFTHHQAGNVKFQTKTNNLPALLRKISSSGSMKGVGETVPFPLKLALLLGACSVIGTTSAVLMAVRLPHNALSLSIGILICLIGVVTLLTFRQHYPFTWRRMTFLGFIASFNKGFSGGGYGPVITGGQLLSGIHARNAVGITSLAEGLTCLVGVIVYLIAIPNLDLKIAPYNTAGALLAVPLATGAVKQLDPTKLRITIGLVTLVLGGLTIQRVLLQ